MPYSEAPGGKRRPWSAPYVIAIAAIVCTILLCAGGWYLFSMWGRQFDPNYWHPSDAPAREAELRRGGPAEADAKRVEAALVRGADTVVAIYPALTWRWSEQSLEYLDCDSYQMFRPIAPEQIVLRHILFRGPLPDTERERAVAVFGEQARQLGAAQSRSFADSFGRAVTTFSRQSSTVAVMFVSGRPETNPPDLPPEEKNAAAVVEGRSACLFPQRYFTENHLPVPTP